MSVVRRTRLRPGRLVQIALGGIALAVAVPYALCPTYDFPAPRSFAGARLYNPYAGADGEWRKINLHAHSRAWSGLTAGRTTRAELLRRYAALGYDGAAVSNYEQLDTTAGGLAVYEQGYGIRKSHLLVVGARHVDWLDYPLVETVAAKQHRIELARRDGAMVIIAHPELRDGFTLDDMRRLCDYDAVEVASDFGDGERQWDAALSAGRLVWGVAGDDSHDADDPRKTGRAWTMVAANRVTTGAVADAIRSGSDYAVVGHNALADITLDSVTVHGDTVTVVVHGAPSSVRFIGSGSRVLATTPSAAAKYVLPPNEPYVRAVVVSRTTRLLLNPIVRTSSSRPAALSATKTEPHFAAARIPSLGRLIAALAR